MTLSVGLIKQGLCLDPARPFVGELERIDLGLAQRQIADLADKHPRRFGFADLSAMPRPQLSPIAMKYERGRVLVIAGSVRYPVAGHLCLQEALASGCGSVQALLPQRLQEQLWSLIQKSCSLTTACARESRGWMLSSLVQDWALMGRSGEIGKIVSGALKDSLFWTRMASMGWRPIRRAGAGCWIVLARRG